MFAGQGWGRLSLMMSSFLFIFSVHSTSAYDLGGVDLGVMPYARGGTVAWDQLAGVGGHKSMISGGAHVDVNGGCWGLGVDGEAWWVAEGMDDDNGIIPKHGYQVYTDARYQYSWNCFTAYPFVRIGYEYWDKGSVTTDWNQLRFFYYGGGVGLACEAGYFQIAGIAPFAPDSNVAPDPRRRYGLMTELGVWFCDVLVAMFFDYKGFEDPDAKSVRTGVQLGYHLR